MPGDELGRDRRHPRVHLDTIDRRKVEHVEIDCARRRRRSIDKDERSARRAAQCDRSASTAKRSQANTRDLAKNISETVRVHAIEPLPCNEVPFSLRAPAP